MNLIPIIDQSLNYSDYRKHVDELISMGKTTGAVQNDELLNFTKLNVHRMNRLDKTIVLSESCAKKVANLNQAYIWLVIGDAWCGDCAQIIPIMNKFAEASIGIIQLKIISRDAFPELIAAYNSRGSLSIPKLLVIDPNSFKVGCTWGPRPKEGHAIMLNWKANQDTISHDDFEKELHLWYAKNKGESIIKELLVLLENCKGELISNIS